MVVVVVQNACVVAFPRCAPCPANTQAQAQTHARARHDAASHTSAAAAAASLSHQRDRRRSIGVRTNQMFHQMHPPPKRTSIPHGVCVCVCVYSYTATMTHTRAAHAQFNHGTVVSGTEGRGGGRAKWRFVVSSPHFARGFLHYSVYARTHTHTETRDQLRVGGTPLDTRVHRTRSKNMKTHTHKICCSFTVTEFHRCIACTQFTRTHARTPGGK